MDGIPITKQQRCNSIMNYSFGYKNAEAQFHKRLAWENCWSEDFALRVVEEYKKFIILSLVTDKMVTPSDEVDQAWHLHQLYNEDYNFFCDNVLGRKFYHQPTAGGQQEDDKYDDFYTRTKEMYQQYFLQAPPEDIWPDNSQRFGERFARISMKHNLVIDRNVFPRLTRVLTFILKQFYAKYAATLLVMALTSTAFGQVASESTSSNDGGLFIILFVLGVVLLIALGATVMWVTAPQRKSSNYSSSYSSSRYSYPNSYSSKSKSVKEKSTKSSDSSSGGCGGYIACSGCSSSSSKSGCGSDSSSSGCGSSGCGGGGCGGGCGG